MKKTALIFCTFLAIVMACGIMAACKNDNEEQYFSLQLVQTTGGTLTAALSDGSVKEGKYLSGSKIKLQATADSSENIVYEFEKLIVGDTSVATPSYTLTITSNTTARAMFRRVPQAAETMSRIEDAFRNTYGSVNFDDGIYGQINQTINVQNEMNYKIKTEFFIANGTADSVIFTELSISVYGISVPILSVWYTDSENAGEARLYFNFLGVEEYYYLNMPTFLEILGSSEDSPIDLGENSDYFSIDLLELLGVVYNVENAIKYSVISFDVNAIFELIAELFAEENSSEILQLLPPLPKTEFILRINYKTVSELEQISGISYEINTENEENDTDLTLSGTVNIMLNTTPSQSLNPPAQATQITTEQLIELLQILFETISDFP